MFNKVIRFVDRLFYETSLTTTRTTKCLYTDAETIAAIRAHCLENDIVILGEESSVTGDDLTENGQMILIASESQFIMGDTVIPVPPLVQQMEPFDKVDITHHQYFPIKDSLPILVMHEEMGYRTTAHYGLALDDTEAPLSGHQVIKDHMETLGDMSAAPDIVSASAHYEDIDFTSIVFKDWDFLVAQVGPTARISIALPNERDSDEYQENSSYEATWACIFARAILITLRANGKDTSPYNEQDLRSNILALLLVDRSGISATSK